MKPNISFLRKVAADGVYLSFRYSARRGGQHVFVGGEATYNKHRSAGFVTPVGCADLGRPAYAKLTEAGIKALSDAEAL